MQNAGGNIPLSKQVRYLESTKAEMENKLGRGAVNHLLSKSFFLLGVGSNDMFAFATLHNTSATQNQVEAFLGSLVSSYLNAITVTNFLTDRLIF